MSISLFYKTTPDIKSSLIIHSWRNGLGVIGGFSINAGCQLGLLQIKKNLLEITIFIESSLPFQRHNKSTQVHAIRDLFTQLFEVGLCPHVGGWDFRARSGLGRRDGRLERHLRAVILLEDLYGWSEILINYILFSWLLSGFLHGCRMRAF